MSITCFLITPTGRAWRFLRRITFSEHGPCPNDPGPYSGHYAKVEIEPGPVVYSAEGWIADLRVPHDDPRWPARCGCGYAFQDGDPWIADQHVIFFTPDGREVSIHLALKGDPRGAPPGAMWEAPWYLPFGSGPDGKHYMLRLPDGHDWQIDGPATNGGGWTRTGEPPRITARPSIASPGYHGWLTDGVLSDDLDGRRYP